MASERTHSADNLEPGRLSAPALHSALSRLIAETADPGMLLAEAGRLIVRIPECRLAWFGLIDARDGRVLPAVDVRRDGRSGMAQVRHWDEAEARLNAFDLGPHSRLPALAENLPQAGTGDPWREAGLSLGCRTSAWTAIVRGDVAVGALGVYVTSRTSVRPADLAGLQAIADDLAHALARLQTDLENSRRLRELEIVRDLTEAMVSQGEPGAYLQRLVERAAVLLGGHSAGMYLVQPDGDEVRCVVSYPSEPDYCGAVLRFGEGAAGTVAQSGRPLILEDYATWPGRVTLYDGAAPDRLRSLLSVPMTVQGRVTGVLHVWRGLDGPPFQRNEADLLQLLANQAAVALENARLLNDSRRRLFQMTLLSEITRSALEATDLRFLLAGMARRIAGLVAADVCLVHLAPEGMPDAAAALGPRWLSSDEQLPDAGALRPIEDLLIGNETLVLDDEGGTAGQSAAIDGLDLRSALVLPLRGNAQRLGGMLVGYTSVHRFSSEEIALCEQVGGQLALALARSLAFEVEREHSNQLEALRQANLRLTSRLDLRTVMEAILEHAIQLVAADDAYVFFYDGEQLTFGAALWAGGARRDPYATPRQHGLTYTVAQSGKRIVVADALTDPLYRDQPWEGSIVGLPLRIGEQVVGVMNVAFERPHVFLDSELRVLELLADQAAVALQNARLYEETASERQRVQLLYDMAQALASRTDPDEIIQHATELTVANLEAHFGETFLLERGSGRLRLRGLAGKEQLLIPEIDARLAGRVGKGLVGWIAESRAATMSSDVTQDQRWVHVTGLDEQIRSAMGAPILSGDELLGVMMIFDRARGAFDQRHLDLLVAISQQLGLALSKAEGYQLVQRRLSEQTLLQQVAQVVNRRLELQPLLEEVVIQVSDVLGYPVVEIMLIEGEVLYRRAGTGYSVEVPLRIPLSEGVVGRVARTNQPSLVRDVSLDPDYVDVLPTTRSEIVVPLRKGGVVFGVLNVESPEVGRLGEDDLRMLSLLADQLSVAIENAALYDHLRQHADDLEQTVADRTAKLAEALTQAQEADRMKSQFVSDVSHELRTPLSNIRLYLDLIKGGKPGRFGDYLETLNRETGRLVSLIEDLLAISRLEAGSSPLDLAPLDLNKLANGLVQDRQRLFREKGLELRFVPSADLPPVIADERSLAHAVANLMTNALHYTSRGAVTISTARKFEDGANWVTLTVADTGLGIAESEQPHLFTRFFRGAAGRVTRVPGTGLGLAICHETIVRHGGHITLTSRLGEGSAFTLWLPLESRA